MKQLIKTFVAKLQSLIAGQQRLDTVNIVAPGIDAQARQNLVERAAFFLPQAKHVRFHDGFHSGQLASPAPILTFGVKESSRPLWLKLHRCVLDIDYRTNPQEGWKWIEAAVYAENHQPDLKGAKQRFYKRFDELQQKGFERSYVFGTGPSLARAAERDWSDGYRVVCNTIVRDQDLWRHIDPHLIAAGDGIYHFGFTPFAKAFRADLRQRLEESDVLFLYPEQFDLIVRREMGHLADKLVPIRIGEQTTVHHISQNNFTLPALGNVLNLLLLPIGCALAKKVGLWGFDGRAPADKLFWSNSAKQSYTELLPTLQAAHPAFFDHNVPKEDPEKYLRMVHGDVLENCLANAESAGWQFEMLHHSWTPTLAKRAAPGVEAP